MISRLAIFVFVLLCGCTDQREQANPNDSIEVTDMVDSTDNIRLSEEQSGSLRIPHDDADTLATEAVNDTLTYRDMYYPLTPIESDQ